MCDLINNKEFIKKLTLNLDKLCRKLQDNYNDGKEFIQSEEDRVAVYDTIEYLNEVLYRLETGELTVDGKDNKNGQ